MLPNSVKKTLRQFFELEHYPMPDVNSWILGRGQSSVAYRLKGFEHVIKVGKDPAYVSFILWARRNPCPELPKVYYFRHCPKTYKYVIVLERLSANKNGYSVDFLDEIDTGPFTPAMKRLLHTVRKRWKNRPRIALDMQYHNFMKRGSTLVLTDPLYAMKYKYRMSFNER